MRLNAVKILKISITINTRKVILEEIQKYLSGHGKNIKNPLKIFTPNTEQLVFAQKNSEFAGLLNQADIAIPDTVGVVWAGHILGKNGPEKPIPGVELMEDLVRLAVDRHVPIGLIGGRGNLAVETFDCLRRKYPGVDGWAERGPEVSVVRGEMFINGKNSDVYLNDLVKRIISGKAKIIFVAFGPPKQEYFIHALSQKLAKMNAGPIVLMAVGGSFDIISGRLPRAPLLLRKMGSEWFWRLILEPWRILRQLALAEFVWMVMTERLFRQHG